MATFCDCKYTTFQKRQNYDDNKKISGCQGLVCGGMNRHSTEDVQGSETVLNDTTVVETCCTFVQTHRIHITKSKALGQLWTLSHNYASVLAPWGLPSGSADKESTCNAGDAGDGCSTPGSGRPPGGGHGNPLQYSCQMRVTKSQTRLKRLSTLAP